MSPIRSIRLAVFFSMVMSSSAWSQHLYWTQEGPNHRVIRADLEGGNPVGIVQGDYVLAQSTAMDSAAGIIFFSDTSDYNSRIVRMEANSGVQTDLFHIAQPDQVVVDPTNQTLFWTHVNHASIRMLGRCDYNGENRSSVAFPGHSIRVDSINAKLYWRGTVNSVSGIHRSNYDGSNVELVIAQIVTAFAFDTSAGKVYWVTQGTTNQGNPVIPTTVKRANVDGTVVEELLSLNPVTHRLTDIAVDPLGGYMYLLNVANQSIERANFDGTEHQIITTETQYIRAIYFDSHEHKITWSLAGNRWPIKRANSDGTAVEVVAELSGPNLYFLQIDPFGGRMYWAESLGFTRQTHRSPLDGSADEFIALNPLGTIESTSGMRYWISSQSMYRSDFQGNDVEWLFDINAVEPEEVWEQVRVDPFEQKVYWFTYIHDGLSFIWRADFDGSNRELVHDSMGEFFKEFQEFTIDPFGRKLYALKQALYGTGHTHLYQSNLDGSDLVLLANITASPLFHFPRGLVVHSKDAYVYWAGGNGAASALFQHDLKSGQTNILMSELRDAQPAGATQSGSFDADPAGPKKVRMTLPVLRDEVVSLRVTIPDFPCLTYFVGADGTLTDQPMAQTPSAWGNVFIKGLQIVPNTRYIVEAIHEDTTASAPLSARTRAWGDIVAPFAEGGTLQPDFSDIQVLVNCFRNIPGYPLEACDLYPAIPDGIVNFSDISMVVDAFRGAQYPFAALPPCP